MDDNRQLQPDMKDSPVPPTNKLSDNLTQLIADKYPHLEDQINEHFGIKKAAPTNKMSQISLDHGATIDDNLNKLVDAINNPETSAEDRQKALSAYKMVHERMEAQAPAPTSAQPPAQIPSSVPDPTQSAKQSALQRLMSKNITR